MYRLKTMSLFFAGFIAIYSCKKDNAPMTTGKNPDNAQDVSVDRFNALAGHLQVRSATNGLPGPNQAVNFDQGPFITMGLSPQGHVIQYYNFDVQSTTPAPIWTFVKNGQPVAGQLNVVNVLPGENGYSDFWQVNKVNVPDNYVANSITSYDELIASGYTIEKTNDLVNCPIVPKGSTASKRLNNGGTGLTRGWYKNKVVYYFNFFEKPLSITGAGLVPTIPIFVTFSINPGQAGGGPDSGFETESPTSHQTHNVISVLPSDNAYSPLWIVRVYDNASFPDVSNINTANAAPLLIQDAGEVNCPVVNVQ
ncbi:MAG: hypothetical protein C5B52_03080 [Bacteroidetes bacterium]|nr:MAG: hypothetical protein C5B52_03080 [Bacteroidota bacterium]